MGKVFVDVNERFFFFGHETNECVEKDEETHKTDDEAGDGSIPRRVRLEGGIEWQRLAVDPLGLHAGVETDIGPRDAKPGHETRDGCHVGEPVEHLAGASVDAHERQEGERRRSDERHYGQPIAKGRLEYRGCVSGDCEAI